MMIEAIQRRVQREGLANVKPVLGGYDDPFPCDRAPSDCVAADTLDAVLIVDAFHEMEHPAVLLRIPDLARSLGQSIKEFKKGAREVTEEIQNSVEDKPQKPAGSQPAQTVSQSSNPPKV